MIFKEGDKFKCVQPKNGLKGAGWELGRIYTIDHIEYRQGEPYILWPKNKSGVFPNAAQKVIGSWKDLLV